MMRNTGWLLCLIILAGCGENRFQKEVRVETSAVALARETEAGDYGLVTTAELKALIDSKQPVLIVDTMPREESYEKAHVPGAKHFLFPIPVMEEWDAKETGGKTQDDYGKLLGEDRDFPIVIYCGFVKCTRSHNGAMWARRMGYTDVKRYPGGIFAWKGAGHATEGGGGK